MINASKSNSVVVVTGGGRGIGRAICERFAKSGAQVVAIARSMSELAETKSIIERAGGRCDTIKADVSNATDVNALVAQTLKQHGRIDVLINCAGVAPMANIEDLTLEIYNQLMGVNVNALYFACRAVWPAMKKNGGGVIVNISSIASTDAFPGFAAYGASKAWVNAWTKGLAEEGRTSGIRVFAVAPGGVETQMLRGVFPDFPKKDTLDPSNVADMVFAITQPECRYATGQTIFVRRQGD
ncbi:MAG: SDR family oxidoreductase [Planctomycetes bacterium]|nr:SDR family oxidoreductase [Planctomycetota bacterium]